MGCCSLSKWGGDGQRGVVPKPVLCLSLIRAAISAWVLLVFPEGCASHYISLPFLTSPPPTHKSWNWKGAGQGQMRMEASAYFFSPSLLISLCQLNTQHAWPGWTALTTCPSLRWKFIQRRKKEEKQKIKPNQTKAKTNPRYCNVELQRLQDYRDKQNVPCFHHLMPQQQTVVCVSVLGASLPA